MTKTTKRELQEDIAAPEMGSVRSIQSGHPADGLEPSRLGMILREAETGDATSYLELAEQMEEKDLHYSAVLGVRKRAIRALELVVEPGGEEQRDEDAAQLLRECLTSSAIKDDLINMLDALGKGYSSTEVIWNTKGTYWTPARLELRDPRWFKFDQNDGRTLLLRTNEGDEALKLHKFIVHFANAKSGLPIRGGLARLAAWAYVFKNYAIRDWAIFMEAYGHPVKLGRYGTNASENDRATLLRAVRRIGTDFAAIIPKEMEIELINGNVTGAQTLFEDSARYWDEQLSKGVLGQVSTTDAIAGGHAVGKVHADVRDDIRNADAEQLATTLQRDLAASLTVLNFGPDAKVPRISFAAPEEHDPRLLLAAADKFVPMGLQIPIRLVQERFGIRDAEDGEPVLKIPAAKSDAVPTETKVTASEQPVLDRSSLDRMLDEVMADGSAAQATDPMLGGIVEALGAATTLNQVRDILDQLAQSGPDEILREFTAQLMYAARLAGETGADIGR